jgi:polysaccharide export outer membrane protein
MKRTIFAFLLILSSVTVWSQTTSTTAQPAAPPKAATDDPSYVIGAEDVLSVTVWKEPDFSNSAVPVRPDGKVSLPLLGDVEAAGKTPSQLADDVTARLKKYIEEPRVTVVVVGMNSRRVFILGEVNKPGPTGMSANMTVLQAISAAGGPTAYANTKKITVMRTENGKQSRYLFNYKEVIKGNNQDQNIILKPGDTIVVP